MALPILSLLSGLFSGGKELYEGHQNRKADIQKAKDNLALATINAKTKKVEMVHEATTNWDIEAMRQSQFSWKDEALMVILFAPFVGSFIPGLQGYIKDGFDNIKDLPYWYQLSLVGIIAASFGLRWLFQGKMDKMMKGS